MILWLAIRKSWMLFFFFFLTSDYYSTPWRGSGCGRARSNTSLCWPVGGEADGPAGLRPLHPSDSGAYLRNRQQPEGSGALFLHGCWISVQLVAGSRSRYSLTVRLFFFYCSDLYCFIYILKEFSYFQTWSIRENVTVLFWVSFHCNRVQCGSHSIIAI